MYKFGIVFSNPWWLLLLIPAVLLTLIPYFRLSKKYRKTRNRITSIVLHLIIMFLCIFILSGMTFTYQVTNLENEIILLVDVSDTEERAQEKRDLFVEDFLREAKYDGYKVGVVTFGYTQEYIVPLTYDVEGIYDRYVSAANEQKTPDTTATDIAAALTYAKDLFTNPETGKIVMVTDGKETDEDATSVIKAVSAKGIKLDAVYISSETEDEDVQIINAEFPDYHINVGDQISVGVTITGKNGTGTATVSMYYNGVLDNENGRKIIELSDGNQLISFNCTLEKSKLNEFTFVVEGDEDFEENNNKYCSYIYLETYNDILVIEGEYGGSDSLEELLSQEGFLNGEDSYNVDVLNIQTDSNVPATVDELRHYDQIIMNNVANSDMPAGFDELLYSYVYDYGGGLFTVGGSDDSGENAHAYDRSDMQGTLYQQMLPVQAITYTPPIGVVIIIDRSGSMNSASGSTGESKLELAKKGAISCMNSLSERDYIGIMTLDSSQEVVLPMTSRTKEDVIRAAINSIEDTGGGTMFSDAIDRAAKALLGLKEVAKRHIIIVTDGEPASGDVEKYESLIKGYYESSEITVSIVGIDISSSAQEKMQNGVDLGHGRLYMSSGDTLIRDMREDLNVPEIKSVNYETFYPIVNAPLSSIFNGVEFGLTEGKSDKYRLSVSLDGFFGVKLKAGAELILVGDYDVPLYAQWKFGEGMVGSFMCDLSGKWSSDFMTDANGQQFIKNAINNLMPTEDIQPNEINVDLTEDNYTNRMSVYCDLQSGEYIEGRIVGASEDLNVELSLNEPTETESLKDAMYYVTTALGSENNYSRCGFVLKQAGVYQIILDRYDESGALIGSYSFFKEFSYSEEYAYESGLTEEALQENLLALSSKGGGALYTDLEDFSGIFADFITDLSRTFDPRFLFAIISIVLFLLDIAVRKFKFKWPHELIREYREKKGK